MPGELAKAASETFQDVDGFYSAKRAGFFIFIALLSAITIGSSFFGFPLNLTIWTGLVDLIKWIGGFILLERTAVIVGAATGNKVPPE